MAHDIDLGFDSEDSGSGDEESRANPGTKNDEASDEASNEDGAEDDDRSCEVRVILAPAPHAASDDSSESGADEESKECMHVDEPGAKTEAGAGLLEPLATVLNRAPP